MRGRWVLFLLLLALVVSAGIGTTNLMWGNSRHVTAESRLEDDHLMQADSAWEPTEVSY